MTDGAFAVPSLADTLAVYTALGLPLFPVWGLRNGCCMCGAHACSIGKHPLGRAAPNGFKDATLDSAVISAWIDEYPGCNWAIATGCELAAQPDGDGVVEEPGYLCILDVDPRNGGLDTLADLKAQHGDLPATATQISGGNGSHYLFRSEVPLASGDVGPGIEFKAVGGYVIVAPSGHASGGKYAWELAYDIADTPIAEIPEWMSHAVRNRLRSPPTLASGVTARETMFGEAFTLAGWLGDALPNGRYMAKCPWSDQHSDGRGAGKDSSSVLLAPIETSTLGGFKCLHSKCQSKGWREVQDALPPEALKAARLKYPPPLKAVTRAPASAAPARTPTSNGVGTPLVATPTNWQSKLIRKATKTGSVLLKNAANAITLLTHDSHWKGRLRYNAFRQVVELTSPPWFPDDAPACCAPAGEGAPWTDEDADRVSAWLLRHWDLELDHTACARAARIVALANAYHPVQEWLAGLTWDGTERLGAWLSTYVGVKASPYASNVGRWWLISACARILNPGCKVDTLLILEGEQGKKKSQALKALASPEWFLDTGIDLGSKDAFLTIRGKIIVELAELDALNRAEAGRAKAFFSSSEDTFRPPYGREAVTYKRQCVFAGTVNEDTYLRDSTGNRRYWPVRCDGTIDVEAIARDREQLWAEAAQAYAGGERWWPAGVTEAQQCRRQQDRRFQGDDWERTIDKHFSVPDRIGQTTTTTGEVLLDALAITKDRWGKSEQTRVGVCLRRLGWVPRKVSGTGGRFMEYHRPPKGDRHADEDTSDDM